MELGRTIPAFPVHRIDEAVTFYETRFGFTCPHKDNRFAILRRNEAEIHLWAAFDKGWKWRSVFLFFRPIRSGAESFLAGTHSCRIEVTEIDKLYGELKQTGVLYGPDTVVEKTAWETREFPALDLHRNLLIFHERVG